ncbi:hypothetical protein SAMN04488100_10542 [Alkalibacterium putridalgicola]|uniref:Uncharacterized protein n=1 Tax=Alkalibacterium putridalgicola TaxID=426703 RepID=A0A1H7RM22_9LACT|nr:hypothetical protein [Alkalibacterium putridalgicola]GEK88901.1 hypothetical protein APU01nite_09400 [Alkalibacterium putridalgicola]SEL61253.1 hypothetical protein SAMN04488100_10542 [Alkalibacterium putridalgicola]
MNNQDELMALAISKLNKILQGEKVERVQIDAEDNMAYDGMYSFDVHVVYKPLPFDHEKVNEGSVNK